MKIIFFPASCEEKFLFSGEGGFSDVKDIYIKAGFKYSTGFVEKTKNFLDPIGFQLLQNCTMRPYLELH